MANAIRRLESRPSNGTLGQKSARIRLVRCVIVPYNAIPMERKRYTFWIDVDQAAALKQIKVRDGMPESEQLRRAIAAWLQTRWRSLKRPNTVTRRSSSNNHQVSR
jgi:hypothetical protein